MGKRIVTYGKTHSEAVSEPLPCSNFPWKEMEFGRQQIKKRKIPRPLLPLQSTTTVWVIQIQSQAFHRSPAIPDVLFSNSVWHPGRCLSQRSRLHPDTNSFGHWLPAVSQDWRPTRHTRLEKSRGVLWVTVWTRSHSETSHLLITASLWQH